MRAVVIAQVAFRQSDPQPDGLRSRKKAKSRLAIEDAALALFDEHGYDATTVEQIAEQAEVSATTFFRYFPSKAEVLLSSHGERLPALADAIIARPADESELVAVRHALVQEWVEAIDTERTAHRARIIGSSPTLQGLSFQRGTEWLDVIAAALAQRRGLAEPDDRCRLAARVTLGIQGTAVEGWMAAGCQGDLGQAVEHAFDLMASLAEEWS
jgi:AcrR family transcriptional regulator